MIAIRTEREIELLREANGIVANVLAELSALVAPGVTTGELDATGEALIRDAGAEPSFLGYQGFPNATCISVDEVIVHGIPGPRVLKNGEIVSIDVGVRYKGYYGDAALSVSCGEVDAERKRLLETTERALAKGIAAAKVGNHLIDVSRAIQNEITPQKFGIVRNFVGHGIGTEMHEEPQIPNFVTGGRGPRLKAGMVMALEPMVNAKTDDVQVLDDGWTAQTADGSPSAHFEHSIVIREDGGEILSYSPKRTWAQPNETLTEKKSDVPA